MEKWNQQIKGLKPRGVRRILFRGRANFFWTGPEFHQLNFFYRY
uniref:Uncharacterized protein n=1 Tax=Lepeophtheirus salmonis TaxID=72036 RepID=A0A0K2TF98_LEPSM